MKKPLFAFLISLLGMTHAAYVTDQLAAGLYSDKALTGDPIKVVTTGQPLEVLSREGKGVQVRLSDKTEGWIDEAYVSDKKPSEVKLLEVQAELRQLKNSKSLAAAKDAVTSLPSVREAKLKQALKEAEDKLNSFKTVEAELKVARQQQIELETLKEKLSVIREAVSVDKVAKEDVDLPIWQQMWFAALSVVILLFVGIAIGAYVIDARMRKRMGGIRI